MEEKSLQELVTEMLEDNVPEDDLYTLLKYKNLIGDIALTYSHH